MKRSGDLSIGRSGDRKRKLTTEARRRGEIGGRNASVEPQRIWPTRHVPGHDFIRAVKGENIWALALAVLRSVAQTIRATLHEIFDESAYDRFLQRTKAERSIESYRAFVREREGAMARKPKCC
jgi:hypothetical protein